MKPCLICFKLLSCRTQSPGKPAARSSISSLSLPLPRSLRAQRPAARGSFLQESCARQTCHQPCLSILAGSRCRVVQSLRATALAPRPLAVHWHGAERTGRRSPLLHADDVMQIEFLTPSATHFNDVITTPGHGRSELRLPSAAISPFASVPSRPTDLGASGEGFAALRSRSVVVRAAMRSRAASLAARWRSAAASAMSSAAASVSRVAALCHVTAGSCRRLHLSH